MSPESKQLSRALSQNSELPALPSQFGMRLSNPTTIAVHAAENATKNKRPKARRTSVAVVVDGVRAALHLGDREFVTKGVAPDAEQGLGTGESKGDLFRGQQDANATSAKRDVNISAIFLFKSPGLYYHAIDALNLLNYVYIALYLVNYIDVAIENHEYFLLLCTPMPSLCVLIFVCPYLNKMHSLMTSISHVEPKRVAAIIEAHDEADIVCRLVRRQLQ